MADELLVYDQDSERCHALSGPSALVFQGLQRSHTLAQIEQALQAAYPQIEDVPGTVHEILAEFDSLHLLTQPAGSVGHGRRLLLKVAGTGLIASLAVPKSAAATSRRLRVTNAVYTTVANRCGQGPIRQTCGSHDLAAFFNTRIGTAGGARLDYHTWPDNGDIYDLGVSDPCVNVRKTLTVTVNCSGTLTPSGTVESRVGNIFYTCDSHLLTTLVCN